VICIDLHVTLAKYSWIWHALLDLPYTTM